MARRGVGRRSSCGRAFLAARTKSGKKALRFIGLTIRAPKTFIILVNLLDHFERFLAFSASVFINGHAISSVNLTATRPY